MKGRLVYTQHSVAFPTLPADSNKAVFDSVGVSDDADGGGTHGEFHWSFYRFSGYERHAVLLECFGDGLGTLYDPLVQRVIRKLRWMQPENPTPKQLIDLLEREGIVPSSHHRRGLRERGNGPEIGLPPAYRSASQS